MQWGLHIATPHRALHLSTESSSHHPLGTSQLPCEAGRAAPGWLLHRGGNSGSDRLRRDPRTVWGGRQCGIFSEHLLCAGRFLYLPTCNPWGSPVRYGLLAKEARLRTLSRCSRFEFVKNYRRPPTSNWVIFQDVVKRHLPPERVLL